VFAGTVGGTALTLLGINAMKLLVVVALVNGLAAAPFLVVVMLISRTARSWASTATAVLPGRSDGSPWA
jgi:hypothetical protein